jgi:hypothetical protein
MALHAGRRIDLSLNPVSAEIVAAVGQLPFRRTLVPVARLYLLLVGMAIGTERFLVADLAGIPLLAGIKSVFLIKIIRLVIQRCPVIGMTLSAVDKTSHRRRVRFCHALGIRAGIQNSAHEQGQGNQYDVYSLFHYFDLPSAPEFVSNL